jgi:hypothetical protein
MKRMPPAAATVETPETRGAVPGWVEETFAWGAVLPLVAGGALAWLTTGTLRSVAMSLTIVWGGAILAFEAGVGRGSRFADPTAPRAPPMLLVLWLFGLAAASMVSLEPLTSVGLLLMGYVTLAVMARRFGSPDAALSLRFIRWLPAIAGLAAVAARLLQKR